MSNQQEGLVAALEKLPAAAGILWRGTVAPTDEPLGLAQPLPVSADVRIATENFTTPLVFAIVASSARDISALSANPANAEFAILPGSLLVPAGMPVETHPVAVQVLLETRRGAQIPTAPSVEQLQQLLSAAIASGPATISTPGRFRDL